MTDNERAAIIGYYRNGMTWEEIAAVAGIWAHYAEQIVKEYLKKKAVSDGRVLSTH